MNDQPSPRERYRNELRATIMEAARDAFIRDGYESLSMRELAGRIGCSHGNLYLHFKSKVELFDSLAEESYSSFAGGLRRILDESKGADPVRLLKKAARAYVDFGLRHPGLYEFAFVLRRPGRPRSRKPRAGYELARALVARCIAAKRFRAVDADLAAQSLWAALHGITSLLIVHDHFPWGNREQVVESVIDSLIEGLKRR